MKIIGLAILAAHLADGSEVLDILDPDAIDEVI